MSKEQKESVLAPCPFCGINNGNIKNKTEYRYHDTWEISCGGCGATLSIRDYNKDTAYYEPDIITAWNRRYVCPDKHGKPVYSDSIVRISASRTGYQSDRYSIAWDETYLHWHFHPLDGSYIETVFTNNVSVDEIELIEKSDGEE